MPPDWFSTTTSGRSGPGLADTGGDEVTGAALDGGGLDAAGLLAGGEAVGLAVGEVGVEDSRSLSTLVSESSGPNQTNSPIRIAVTAHTERNGGSSVPANTPLESSSPFMPPLSPGAGQGGNQGERSEWRA